MQNVALNVVEHDGLIMANCSTVHVHSSPASRRRGIGSTAAGEGDKLGGEGTFASGTVNVEGGKVGEEEVGTFASGTVHVEGGKVGKEEGTGASRTVGDSLRLLLDGTLTTVTIFEEGDDDEAIMGII